MMRTIPAFSLATLDRGEQAADDGDADPEHGGLSAGDKRWCNAVS
jgi:hypothetical protein